MVSGSLKDLTSRLSDSASRAVRPKHSWPEIAPFLQSTLHTRSIPILHDALAKGLRIIATFYVLPSRHLLGQRFGELLTSLFPRVRYTLWDWPDLAEYMAGLVESQSDTHVVYREDLDEIAFGGLAGALGSDLKDVLMRHFGAAFDDEIIEIPIGASLAQFLNQRSATETMRKPA